MNTSGIQAAADAARGYAEGGDIADRQRHRVDHHAPRAICRQSRLQGVNSARDAVLRGLR